MDKAIEAAEYDCLNEYQTVGELGSGTFGRVFEVKWKSDILRGINRTYAMKVIEPDYFEYVEDEILTGQKIAKLDPQNQSCCIHLLRAFFQVDLRTYLVFPKYGETIDNFQIGGGMYSLNDIRHISYQILQALKFIHENSIIHCDMKGDNVIIVDSAYDMIGEEKHLKRTDVKLIDFGICVDTTRQPNYYEKRKTVQNRTYRAPEVTLNIGYSYPIDIWGAACILYAMYTNQELLDSRASKICHLGALEKTFGKFPMNVISKIPEQTKTRFFDADGNLRVPELDTERQSLLLYKKIEQYAKPNNEDSKVYVDLLEEMFELDPDARVTAAGALNHPFFLS